MSTVTKSALFPKTSPLTFSTNNLSLLTRCARGLLTKIEQGCLDEIQPFAAFLTEQTRMHILSIYKEEKTQDLFGLVPILLEALCHPQIRFNNTHKHIVAKTLRHHMEVVFHVAHA